MSHLRADAWRWARVWRQEFAEVAVRAALPAAMLLAAVVTSNLPGGRSAAAETLFLAFWAAAVFIPLAVIENPRRPLFAALGLAVAMIIVTLPRSGGARLAAVSALLTLSLLSFASLTPVVRPVPRLRTCAALALATAIVLHGHRLFAEGLAWSTVVLLGLLPGAAAAVAARLAASGRAGASGMATGAALALLCAPQLAAEPWWIELAFATAALSAGFGTGAVARFAHRLLFLFAAATLLAGSFPWLRSAPVATVLGAAGDLLRPVAETPLGGRVAVLTEAAPRLEFELSGTSVRSLIIDSYLTHGVDLACGQGLAEVELLELLEEADGRGSPANPWRATLIAGRDSADWAAGRPDVEARLACPAPEPWISWIPGAGRFLGQTTRARFAIPEPQAARRLTLERRPDLPAGTSIAVFFVATER